MSKKDLMSFKVPDRITTPGKLLNQLLHGGEGKHHHDYAGEQGLQLALQVSQRETACTWITERLPLIFKSRGSRDNYAAGRELRD